MQAIADVTSTIQPGKDWPRIPPVKAGKMPKRVSLNDLDTSHPLMAKAVQQARAWAARKRNNYDDASLILSGPNGTGKTHIARSIWWSSTYEPEGDPGMALPVNNFFGASDLLFRLSPTRNEYNLDVIPRVSSLIGEDAQMVIVDDIGKEMSLPYIGAKEQKTERLARYFRFFEYCYQKSVSIIATTNLSINGGRDSNFAQYIGIASFDRLSEMAPAGFMVGLAGVPSWRVKASGRK